MERESFVFYKSFYESLEGLPPATASNLLYAIIAYGIEGKEVELNGVEKNMFTLIKPQLDANNKKHEAYLRSVENGQKGAEYGKKGGRPRKEENNEPPKNPPKTPPGFLNKTPPENPINVNDNVNENVNVNVNVKESGDSNEPPVVSESISLAKHLLDTHRKEYPDFLTGKDAQTVKRWAVDIEKLIRIDKKEPVNIRKVIDWVKTPGNFWFFNIESGKKLREKYERLWGQMNSQPKNYIPDKPKINYIMPTYEQSEKYFEEQKRQKAIIQEEQVKNIALPSLSDKLKEVAKSKA